jgi:hypothetical protein
VRHIESGLRYWHLATVHWAGPKPPNDTLELYAARKGAFAYGTNEWRPPGTLYVRTSRSFAERFKPE